MQNYVDVMHKYTEEKLQLCYDNIRNKTMKSGAEKTMKILNQSEPAEPAALPDII